MFCWGSAIYHRTDSAAVDDHDDHKTDKSTLAKINAIPDIIVPYASKVIEYPYAAILLKAPVKFLVVVLYLAYLGVAVWGCTRLEEGLELQNLAPDDSYLADFYPQYDDIFGSQYSGRIMVAVTDTLDYTDEADLNKINELVASFQRDEHFFEDPRMTEFWLYAFQGFLFESQRPYPPNMPTLIAELKAWFEFPGADRFSVDVEFNDDDTAITASRFLVQAGGVLGAEDERDLVIRCRELTDDSSLNAVAYFRAFVYWEQYIIIRDTTLMNLGIAVASCLVVATLLVPSINALFMVAISIVSITVGVVGYMSLWDVSLDSVSMINLVMCIGFSVDFSAHICYHFSIASRVRGRHNSFDIVRSAKSLPS